MNTLIETLRQLMTDYVGEALNGYSYLTSSADQQIFTVVSIGEVRGQRVVDTGLVVRVKNNQIIIEYDVNDKPLVDALLSAGIPRNQIVLAYTGESTDEAA